LKVHIITYFVEDGEAGINSVFRDKRRAKTHFAAIVRETFEGDDDVTKKEIDAAVKTALKEGYHEYTGSGCGARPWYKLTTEDVQ
jgi:hypothetical protein